jgi:hypothetical protein
MQVTARRARTLRVKVRVGAWEFERGVPIKVAGFMVACELTVRFFEFGAVSCVL